MNFKPKHRLSALLHLFVVALISVDSSSAQSFSTQGRGLRDGVVASVGGKSVIYLSEVDGAVSCYSTEGEMIWRVENPTPAVCFEIEAADLDGDGDDELLSVCGDGSLRAWSPEGALLWHLKPEDQVRLVDLAVVSVGNKKRVYVGGNNYIIYELDSKGKLLTETKVKGSIRKLEAGNFCDAKRQSLFVYTMKLDKFGSLLFGFMDPESKQIIKSTQLAKLLPKGSLMLYDFDVSDMDGDGRDDLLLFTDNTSGAVVAISGECERVFEYIAPSALPQRYAHTKGVSLQGVGDGVVMQYGGIIYHIGSDGKLKAQSGERYKGIIFNDIILDKENKNLLGLGQVGGDNSIYRFVIGDERWIEVDHVLDGIGREVEQNLDTLYNQLLAFKLPLYQKKSEKPYILSAISEEAIDSAVLALDGGKLILTEDLRAAESTPRTGLIAAIGEEADERDKRRKYVDSREKIVAEAARMEREGIHFISGVGHGNDPFIIQPETMLEIIKVAPTCCEGFWYAEMESVEDKRVIYLVDKVIPQLQKQIKECGSAAKIYFRFKNMFWASGVHRPLWSKLFTSKEYSDIIVLSTEDTNNRLQDINFAGRVGLVASGLVNEMTISLVDDNPTSWRPLSPGGQRSVSPYLRNGALAAAYGARYGIIYDIKYLDGHGFNLLYALFSSGAIPVVESEDLLSVGSYMTVENLDDKYISRSIDNIRDMEKYDPADLDGVIAMAGIHWAGAATAAWDYSRAMGVEYRWLSFLPPMPSGMVGITTTEAAKSSGKPYFTTDAHYGIKGGKQIKGEAFYPTMREAIDRGAEALPLLVEGAAWSLFRIDDHHARLLLVDSGYIDPAESIATIKLQGAEPIAARDILSGRELKIEGGVIKARVGAGSLTIIDLEYKDKI
ncbi:MAG: hypothetical protein SNG47_07395 [Rikenellaceae bacterium]